MHAAAAYTVKSAANSNPVSIQTTGLADPGPIAKTFFVDQILMAKASLDSVTTVVDAFHIRQQLLDSNEAVEQVAFADQILLNKADTVTQDEIRSIAAQLRQLNPYAPIHTTRRTQIDLDKILARGKFDLQRIPAQTPEFFVRSDDRAPPHGANSHVHDENCAYDRQESHLDKSGITSVSLSADIPMDLSRLGDWLEDLLQRQGQDILRGKGILDIAGESRKLVFQSVHMMMESDFQHDWAADERRYSRIVFIGRGLEEQELRQGFEACTAKP